MPVKGLEGSFPELYRMFVAACRVPDYAISTKKSSLGWINRLLFFHLDSLPESWAEHDVASFLDHLAVKRKVAGATQALALDALVLFFARVLERPLGDLGPFKRPKKPARVPTVLAKREVALLLSNTHRMTGLMARLMYGTGMRLKHAGGHARRRSRLTFHNSHITFFHSPTYRCIANTLM
ncbi:MAG: phage integrase N-terminal SAM-like domain-containing protein [Sedimenticola sp.]